jgi:hypothetical protein
MELTFRVHKHQLKHIDALLASSQKLHHDAADL